MRNFPNGKPETESRRLRLAPYSARNWMNWAIRYRPVVIAG